MEVKKLRFFLEIAANENMTQAANRLHITQSALSKQMKALEQELGVKLFSRRSFAMELTKEGELLKLRARDLLDMEQKIRREISTLNDSLCGDIYLGLPETYQVEIIARALARLKKRVPKLTYHTISGGTEQVLERLKKGMLDFAAIVEEPDRQKYEVLRFPGVDTWGAIMSATHPLASRKTIGVDDLIGYPLLTSQQGWDNDITPWAGKKIRQLDLQGTFQLAYNGSVFARCGFGILLSFSRLIDTSIGSGLVFRPLEPMLATPMYLVWKKDQTLTATAKLFLKYLKEELEYGL